jgi:hypothetical protein
MITGRPRKTGPRKPSGRLRQAHKPKPRNPFANYLVGTLFLRKLLDARAMGGFYSFLQIAKHANNLRSASFSMRVQGGRLVDRSYQLSEQYLQLVKDLGHQINILHALERDQLIAPIATVRALLKQVPLTFGGMQFMHACESHNPTVTGWERGQQAERL